MAQLHARGQLGLGTEFVNESFVGTANYLLDPRDPFPAGFTL